MPTFKNFAARTLITSAISKVVLGETALQSTKTGELSEPSITWQPSWQNFQLLQAA